MRFSKLGRPFILMAAAHIHNSTWKLLNVFLDLYCSHIFAIYLPNIVILFIHIIILLLLYVCSVHTTSVACCPSWKRDPCFIAHPKVSSIEVLVSCADLKPFKTNVWYGVLGYSNIIYLSWLLSSSSSSFHQILFVPLRSLPFFRYHLELQAQIRDAYDYFCHHCLGHSYEPILICHLYA